MTGRPAATRLFTQLRRTAEVFDELGRTWALVGGLAVSVRSEPRFTRDVDVTVAVTGDDDAEALVSAFVSRGFGLVLSLEHQALGRLAAVRLLPPGEQQEGIVIDLLFSSSGIEAEICRDAERIEVASSFIVPVAAAGHLLVMKLLARSPDRPQDEIDLRALVQTLTPRDRQRARAAAARIEEIGANRSKSLRDDVERWLGKDA